MASRQALLQGEVQGLSAAPGAAAAQERALTVRARPRARRGHLAYRPIHRDENWELRGHRGELREKKVKQRGDKSARMRNARAQ
jgi:hypothetical protein